MAETKWERLDPRAPILRADDLVQRIGDGWAAVQGRVEKVESTTYMPLPAGIPIARDAHEPRPEPPPPPSELELRDRLKTALAAEQEATTKHDTRPRRSSMRRGFFL